jgi:beta-galactosidase/beta-glucuronidase
MSWISDLRIIPDIDNGKLSVTVLEDRCHGPEGCPPVDLAPSIAEVTVTLAGAPIGTASGEAGVPLSIGIPDPQLWSPDNPVLYDLKIRLITGGKVTDEAMQYDIEMLKKMGFNMMRKHVKIENRRFYYHTDRLGMLVWQDMPGGDDYIGGDDPDIEKSAGDSTQFITELSRMIDTKFNNPSIIMWVIYNEGWGQYNTPAVTEYVSHYDTTRLVNSASVYTQTTDVETETNGLMTYDRKVDKMGFENVRKAHEGTK